MCLGTEETQQHTCADSMQYHTHTTTLNIINTQETRNHHQMFRNHKILWSKDEISAVT